MRGKKFKLPCQKGSKTKDTKDDREPPRVLTPAMLQIRRQERLVELQAEHSHLEQQLTEEKGARLTSRASDSDLEYLNSESPPLKRNSISLQDLPQSVLRLRREKELRTLKTEIEYLKKVSEISTRRSQSAESVSRNIQPIALAISPLTTDKQFPERNSHISSPIEGNGNTTTAMPLSQHISHLKTQRTLNQIRNDLEDLAIKFINKAEQEAKCSSLQDLPRTALNVQRERQLLTITNEIEKMKKYSSGQTSIVSTVLQGKKRASQQNLVTVIKEEEVKEEKSEKNTAKNNSEVAYGSHNSSLRRQREQELCRVRTELKNLADKLHYTIEDRSKLVSRNAPIRSSIKKQAEIIAEDVESAQHV